MFGLWKTDVLLYRWTLHQSQVKRTSIDLNVLKFCELRFSIEVIYHLFFSKHIHFNSKQTTVWRHLLVCLSGCEQPIASLSFSSMQVCVRCFCLHWNVKSKFNSTEAFISSLIVLYSFELRTTTSLDKYF